MPSCDHAACQGGISSHSHPLSRGRHLFQRQIQFRDALSSSNPIAACTLLIERKREMCSEKLFSLYLEYLKTSSSAPTGEGVQHLQLKHIVQPWYFKLSLLLARERSMALHPGALGKGFLGRKEQLLGTEALLRKQLPK